jgi:putrescine transport system permease protein
MEPSQGARPSALQRGMPPLRTSKDGSGAVMIASPEGGAPADRSTQLSLGARLLVGAPYLWLIGFFFVPFLIVLKISFSETAIALPPYTPVLDLAAGFEGVRNFIAGLSFANYVSLAGDELYILSYLKSLKVATISTAVLVACGIPLAYAMARAPRRAQPLLVMLVVLPFWTSFLIRVYAWINILQRDGLLNQALIGLGVIERPLTWLATDTAVYIGLVYSYLPFMVLPLYASFTRLDESLLEAAADLGCPRWKAFFVITLPLAARGIGAGALLCFVPIVGEFVVPDLLGGSDSAMIGQTLWTEFFANKDWPVASAVAVVLLVLLMAPIALYQHLQTRSLHSSGLGGR